jgi:signal peptidase I
MRESIKRFLWPKMDRRFALRLAIVAAVTYLLFGWVTRPFRVVGKSMEPTYAEGSLVLGSRFRYAFREVRRGDVVFVMLAGPSVMYLKRVAGLPGDTVEFRKGALVVNGERQEEPWLRRPCDWDRKPETVEPGFLFVVGDNRSMPIGLHEFGMVLRQRIFGGPLW